jgi:dihydrofolate reductase
MPHTSKQWSIRGKPMRRLVEITLMSLDGVIDAPDLIQEAQPYIYSEEHTSYQNKRLFAADALLLGRKTYEKLSKAYVNMIATGEGLPMEFVNRMNNVPKYVASRTIKETSWNATVIHGDITEEVRKLKSQPGNDIVKYGTGALDRVLFGQRLVDLLCIVVYPFVLGHGTHLFEAFKTAMHLRLSDLKQFESGVLIMEYVPKK